MLPKVSHALQVNLPRDSCGFRSGGSFWHIFFIFFSFFTCSGFAEQSKRMEKEMDGFNDVFFSALPGGCFPPWEWRLRASTLTSSTTSPWTSSPWTTRDTGSGSGLNFTSAFELPKCSIRLVLDFIAFLALKWEKRKKRTALIGIFNKGTAAHIHTHTQTELDPRKSPASAAAPAGRQSRFFAGGFSDVRWSRLTQLDGSGLRPALSWRSRFGTRRRRPRTLQLCGCTVGGASVLSWLKGRLRQQAEELDLRVSTLPAISSSKREGSGFDSSSDCSGVFFTTLNKSKQKMDERRNGQS